MENENNNYTFTPITEDNSVTEIKNDFFGSEEMETKTDEVPPVLENVNTENASSEEQIEITAGNNEPEVNNNLEAVKEPVEINVPSETVTEEQTNSEEVTNSVATEPIDNNPSESEAKTNDLVDFFDVTEVPTQEPEENTNDQEAIPQESNIEENEKVLPVDMNESEESTPENTVADLNKEEIKPEETIVNPNDEVKEEPIIEKEKIVYGRKCPNCGEVTSEDFCPNCGFLIE